MIGSQSNDHLFEMGIFQPRNDDNLLMKTEIDWRAAHLAAPLLYADRKISDIDAIFFAAM